MASSSFGENQMRLILEIADRGTISAAAAALGISQPAASQQLSGLEAALGRRLFRRGTRELSLTMDGEAYLLYARAMVRIGDAARRHFEAAPASGAIRLGLTEDIAYTVLPVALMMFSRAFPDFAFTVECGSSSALFAGLDAGRHDVVLAKRRGIRPRSETLWTQPLGWYGRSESTGVVKDPVDLVVVPEPSELREAGLEALRRAGRSWRILFQSNSVATIEAMIRAGAGISVFGNRLHGPGLVELGPEAGLPELPPVQIVLERGSGADTEAIEAFSRLVGEAAALVTCSAGTTEAAAAS
ncbi:MAG: LysR family transcriptional regulator [Gluconacetobacter diazotrophicus]|nr:LysR family transcriptional regulator [Gluconacetobacter diazotrophicus]